MLSTVLSIVADFFVGLFKSLLTKNRDERMGALETVNKTQAEEVHALEVDKVVSDKVDGMSGADLAKLQSDLNKRPAD